MRNRQYTIKNAKLGNTEVGVLYYPTGQAVFCAQRQISLTGVFSSLPIDGESSLIRWDKLLWSASVPLGSSLLVYVRNAATTDALASSAWNGPFLNGSGEDISGFTARYFQVRMILDGDGWTASSDIGVTPLVNSFSVQGMQFGNEEVLYTKAFELGFIPQHIVVTYNGRIPEGTLLQIGVAGDDTIDSTRYVAVQPNQVQSLTNLPDLSGKLKMMLKSLGNQLQPFEVNKIGFFVSGNKQTLLNS